MTAQRTQAERTPDAKQRVRDQFGPAAARYAVSDVHVGGPDLTAMLRAVALTGRERLLDVGTGAGHTALAFAPRVTEVVALDLTEAMLEQTRIEADNLRAAIDRFPAAIQAAVEAMMEEVKEMQRKEMSRIVVPGAETTSKIVGPK